jgi:hypothetical protein
LERRERKMGIKMHSKIIEKASWPGVVDRCIEQCLVAIFVMADKVAKFFSRFSI